VCKLCRTVEGLYCLDTTGTCSCCMLCLVLSKQVCRLPIMYREDSLLSCSDLFQATMFES